MSAAYDPAGYQWCFCDKGIAQSEEHSAVVLSAVSVARWKKDSSAEGQSYWAHSTCLIENCRPSYPWEMDVILGEHDG